MASNATDSEPWIHRQAFWSGVLVGMAFLAGVGLGARIAVMGIRWSLQTANTQTNTTVAAMVASTATGEAVGKIDLLSDNSLTLLLADQSQVTFGLTTDTTAFEYTGEQTPLLPGENRPQHSLTLADLQPNDMVVVRYANKDALTIQKIR